MSDWALLNEEEVPEIAEELRINAEEKAKRKADLKIAKETQVLKKKEEQLRQQQEEEKRRQERLEREYLARQERDRKTQEQIRRQKQQRVSQLPQPAKTDKRNLIRKYEIIKGMFSLPTINLLDCCATICFGITLLSVHCFLLKTGIRGKALGAY